MIIKLHEYLGVHKAEDTCTSTQNPFCWYNNIDGKNYYESLLDDPARLQLFNIAMSTEEAALPVLGMFPFDTLTPDENDKERAVIVDVGGGRGHSMVQIKNANPNFSGRIVLQDRKAVLDAVPDDQLPGIEKMVHDFYTPQPVKRKWHLSFRIGYQFISKSDCSSSSPQMQRRTICDALCTIGRIRSVR